MDAGPEPRRRETGRFIPLTRQAVIADLCADPERKGEDAAFRDLAVRLQRHRGHDYRVLAEEVRRTYLPFSPDRDTVRVLTFTAEELAAMERRISELAVHLLERANYHPIDTERLNAILNQQTPYSLRIAVDLAEYDALTLYVRDEYETEHSVRRPEFAYLVKAHYKVRIYRRLFILLKLKSDDARAAELVAAAGKPLSQQAALKRVRRRRRGLPPNTSTERIYIKVFKDMPEHDLQILFPLRQVQFRPFDKLKFYATAGGGTLFGVFTTTGKILAATNPFALAGAFVGFVALLGRQITTFFNQRTRYMMELSQKLFFHNLANNRAALALLLDRAEEEDVKEDLITLYFFGGEAFHEIDVPTKKRIVNEAIAERYGVAIDFELEDALDRLARDGAVRHVDGRYTVLALAEAAALYADLGRRDDEDDAAHICDDAPKTEVVEA